MQCLADPGRSQSRAPAGRKTCRNIAAQPLVALLWPPTTAGDYNLIIDGDATAVDLDDDGKGYAVIEATHAILHRNAEGGGNDCAELPAAQAAEG